ncbi:MAG: hypothetical protein V1922_04285 [bacterium]
MKKIFVFCIALIAVFFFLGKELNPLDPHLFSFHDNTQAARLQEFALNLRSGIIPPRLAPHFSFQHGFPVFNFYAPFAYWIGSLIHLTGISSAISLKILMLLGLLLSFISFFLFGSLFFGMWGGILGASIYSSSLWMAVEIFVRGNIGEIWFMALLPLSLYLLKRSDAEGKRSLFFFSTVVLSFLFTVHNVLSLVSVIFIGVFSVGLTHKKKAFVSLILGLLLSSYFLLPAVVENKLTYVNEIASKTKYSDHFLCAWQLWKANKWSYGGSGSGCLNDDMSFQIGKIHLLLAGLGVGIFFLSALVKKGKKKGLFMPIFILCTTIFSAFLTIEASKPLWDLFSPVMSMFQFPWRFLPFVVFGAAYFASYIISCVKSEKINIIIAATLSLGILYSSAKFFSKPWEYTSDEYKSMFLTEKYIEQKAAYEIPEYFPRSGNYAAWRMYDKSEIGFYTNSLSYKINTPFYKKIAITQDQITLPIHYFPFWEIQFNGRIIVPKIFDSLGRPILSHLPPHSTVVVRYNETPIEKIGNGITISMLGLLFIVCINKKLWKKTNTILQ